MCECNRVFGTLFLSCDSMITIHNHWVPLKKNLFGTHNLSEDWNPNLNFMWVPWQIWEQQTVCFWIQTGFKSRLYLCGSQIITITGSTDFITSPHFLSLWRLFQTLLDLAQDYRPTPKSLTDSKISKLKTEILKSEGVLNLVSSNESHLLNLTLAEKLDDLNHVAAMVSRLGKKCSELALQGFQHNQHEEGWGLRKKKKKKGRKIREKWGRGTNCEVWGCMSGGVVGEK